MERIALLSVHSCPLGTLGKGKTGGMSVHLVHLSRELAKRGVQADIYTLAHDAEGPAVVELSAGVRLIHMSSPTPAPGPLRGQGPGVGDWEYDLDRELMAFAKEVRRQQELEGTCYCLVHSHYWMSGKVGTILAKAWGVPNVVTFHTVGRLKQLAYPETEEHALRDEREQEVATSADVVVAFTPYEQEALVQLYGVNPERVRVVPCGVDVEQFRPIERTKAKGALGYRGKKVGLWVGRVEPIKGLRLLLQAVAQIRKEWKELRLVIVGGNRQEDPELQRLMSLAGELGMESMVECVGTVPHAHLSLYYQAADVFIFPSYQETFGLVCLEAMACGVPVIAGRAGGPEYIVQDGITGSLVPAQSPELYAQKLRQLLQDERLRLRMGQSARSFATTLTWGAMVQKLMHLYVALNEPCVLGTAGGGR